MADNLDLRHFGRKLTFGPKSEMVIRQGFDQKELVRELRAFCDRIEAGMVNIARAQHMQEADGDSWHTSALYIEFEEFEESTQERETPDRIIDLPS